MKKLMKIYELMKERCGFLNWWPGHSKLEVMIGAILTQNTAWTNAQKAIHNLKEGGLLNVESLRGISEKKLARLIKPSGYYNQKAKKLKNLIKFLDANFEGSILKMQSFDKSVLRTYLLNVKGIGDETADSILLYALEKEVFVVDAYTKRIFSRIGIIEENWDYKKVSKFFIKNLPRNIELYNDYYAQIVML